MNEIKYVINPEMNKMSLVITLGELFSGKLTENFIINEIKIAVSNDSIILPKFTINIDEENRTAILELQHNYQLERFCDVYHAIRTSGNPDRNLTTELAPGKLSTFLFVEVNPISVPTLKFKLKRKDLEKIGATSDDAIISFIKSNMESNYSCGIPEFIYTIEEQGFNYIVRLYFNENYKREDIIDLYDCITIS